MDLPMMVGGTHTSRSPCLDGGGCQSPPRLTEPLLTCLRWWEAHTGKRLLLDERGCRSPAHSMEPLSDSPAIVGGVHQQASMLGWRRVSIAATSLTGKYACLDGGWVLVVPTPHGATVGLAHDGGRRTLAAICAWTEGCRPPPHFAGPFLKSPATMAPLLCPSATTST
jgi:hypothetical protein